MLKALLEGHIICSLLKVACFGQYDYVMPENNYGMQAAYNFQNFNQNILMTLQSMREQRELELKIRQQQLAEKESRMEEEKFLSRLELINKQNELYNKLVKQNEELEKRLNESQQTTASPTKSQIGYEGEVGGLAESKPDENGRPLVTMPESLKGEAEKVLEIIDTIRQHIDEQITSGRILEAKNAAVPEVFFIEFPEKKKEQIQFFVNYEVEKYKEYVLKAFK